MSKQYFCNGCRTILWPVDILSGELRCPACGDGDLSRILVKHGDIISGNPNDDMTHWREYRWTPPDNPHLKAFWQTISPPERPDGGRHGFDRWGNSSQPADPPTCNCGAKHTRNANLHADWCVMVRGY